MLEKISDFCMHNVYCITLDILKAIGHLQIATPNRTRRISKVNNTIKQGNVGIWLNHSTFILAFVDHIFFPLK